MCVGDSKDHSISSLGKRTRYSTHSEERLIYSQQSDADLSDNSVISGSNEASISNGKRVKKEIESCSVFLKKAHDIVTECNPEIAGWTDEGQSFIVRDIERFASDIMPTVYKHNNWSSFVRQLNSYGFRKRKCRDIPNACEFIHPLFTKNRVDLLHTIKRSSGSNVASSYSNILEMELSEVRAEYVELENKVQAMSAVVGELTNAVRDLRQGKYSYGTTRNAVVTQVSPGPRVDQLAESSAPVFSEMTDEEFIHLVSTLPSLDE